MQEYVFPILALTLGYFLPFAFGSHFRGGIITWKPTQEINQVLITFRVAWRRDYSSDRYCDDSTIASGSLVASDGSMSCMTGCSGNINSMSFKCTDYSVDENWSAGENSFTYTFPDRSDDFFQFGYTGGAWISLVKGGGNWEMRTTANLTVRTDTGQINSSPVSAMEPVVRVQHGCNVTIEIPVNDVDVDEVRCRWSKASQRECAGVCDAFEGAVLDERTCKIFYSAVGKTGWYAAAIQIEDFATPTDSEPLSSVPLQFLISVFSSDKLCASKPVFVEPTRVDGSCVGVPFNSTFDEPLIARSGGDSVSVTEIKTVSPIGMTKSSLEPYGASSREWYVNITWSPTQAQEGSNIFCFSAVDSAQLTSEKSCITLLGGVTPPSVVNGSWYPVGDILPTHNEFSVEFDMQFKQPTRPTYMYFYESDGRLAHKVDVATVSGYPEGSLGRKVTIDPKFTFREKEHYYILLDPGIARGLEYCGAESPSLRDPKLWTVRIRDVTPPVLTFTNKPPVSNENVTITWTFNEEVSAQCTLQISSSASTVLACNNSWSGHFLSEGYYAIYVQATDLENNVAAPVRHTWKVDRTPPVVTIQSSPPAITNKTTFQLIFQCDEDCETQCSFHEKGQNSQFSSCGYKYSRRKYFNTGTMTTDRYYVFQVRAVDSVGNTNEIQTVEWQTDFIAPTISQVDTKIVNCGDSYSPNATGFPQYTDNIDGNPEIKYRDESSGQCGIDRIWTCTDDAGNVAVVSQEILFTSPRQPVVQFPKDTVVACGSLESETRDMIQKVIVEHPCGLPVNVSYIDPDEANQCEKTFTRHWSVSDDCGGIVRGIQTIQVLELQLPDTPVNGQKNIDLQYTLKWPVYPGSLKYAVYIWNADERKPSSPVSVTTEPQFTPPTPLKPGTRVLWQVDYVLNTNETIPSPQWGFETRKYPDLAVETITLPPVAYSGQTFTVRWSVRNIGNLTTQATRWYDAVYISLQDDFTRSRRVNVVRQNNILFPSDGYTSDTEVQMRNTDIGQFYVFVQTNIYGTVNDIDRSNNLRKADDILDVKLTPPPDLRVDIVTTPSSSYSGSEITISYTVSNHGSGATDSSRWTDRIFWSTDQFYNSSDRTLASSVRYGGLNPGESYTSQIKLVVPRYIFGNFYIVVVTDIFNQVFEHTAETNNIGVSSNAISVTLSPPPDLRITNLQVEGTYNTGETIQVQWTVENNGDPPDKITWFDSLTLSSVKGLVSRVLTTPMFSGSFKYGDTYDRFFSFQIGADIPADKYNITVHTDYKNSIFEFDKEDNNIKTEQIEITQSLPDLQFESVSAELNSTRLFNQLHVTWSVQNAGPGRTLASHWVDTVVVSHTGISLPKEYDFESIIERSNPLYVNDQYNMTTKISLPHTVFGNVNVRIIIDEYGQTADRRRANNFGISSVENVPLKAFDVRVEKLEMLNAEIYSGSNIQLKVEVKNVGVDIPEGESWVEQIILSSNSLEPLPNLAQLKSTRDGPLQMDESYISSFFLKVPESLVGSMFLHFICNPGEVMFEGGRTKNNRRVLQVTIQTPPSPDFTITEAAYSVLSIGSSKLISVEWTVLNQGNSMKLQRQWNDVVYLTSQNTVTNNFPTGFVALESIQVSGALEANQRYQLSKQILIPSSFIGRFRVFVKTDANEVVVEQNAEDNNLVLTEPSLEILPPPKPKLSAIIDSLGSSVATSGHQSWISYSVTNIGDMTTGKTSWIDTIYVTNMVNAPISTVIAFGRKISNKEHVGALEPGDTYSVNASIIIPYGVGQSVYFYVVVDNGHEDPTQDNPVVGTTSSSNKIEVKEGEIPNLVSTMSSNVLEIRGGEPYMLEYEVANLGEESHNLRYDAVYLSDDQEVDQFDRKLASKSFTSSFATNETVNFTIPVFIPFDLETKNYFLILSVDNRNEIYESNEDDNIVFSSLTIIEAVSTDIAVVDIQAPQSVSYGNSMTVDWKIRNNGTLPATGYKCDSVYLSDDLQWDITDEQVGNTVCGFITVRPYTSNVDDVSARVSSSVPLVADGEYTAIVKSRSNILDNNLENNVGYSPSTTRVSIQTITIDSSKSFTLHPNGRSAYRIPNVPLDETLIISTQGNNVDNFHEVKVKFDKPATRFNFDIVSSSPLMSSQTVLVPNTRLGEYYILIEYSGSVSALPKASLVQLHIRLAKFEIINTRPSRAAPRGNVTIRFDGTLLPKDVDAKLTYNEKTLSALHVFRFSSTLVYATFDMRNTSVGQKYSATFSSVFLNLTTTKSDIIDIVDGIQGRAKAQLTTPGALRPGERGIIYVDIQNEGDTDIMTPIIAITTNSVGHLKYLTNAKQTDYLTRHVMVTSPDEGPGGILPPKEYSRLTFEVKQIDEETIGRVNIQVKIIQPDKSTEHVYMKLKEDLRFSHYDVNDWDRVWNNFLSNVGSTWYSLNEKISEVANQMSRVQHRVLDLSDYVVFFLDMADNPKGDLYISETVDLYAESSDIPHVGLQLSRTLPAKLGLRYKEGVFGTGWSGQFWDTRLKNLSNALAELTFERTDFLFTSTGFGTFTNEALGSMVIRNSGCYFKDKRSGKEFRYNFTTGNLMSVASEKDGSSLKLIYDKADNVHRIVHSSGTYLEVMYDSNNRVSIVSLRNGSLIPDQDAIYTYGIGMNTLKSVSIDGKITGYEYNVDKSLKSISYPDGRKEVFEYSMRGHLTSRSMYENGNKIAEMEQHFDGSAGVNRKTKPDGTDLFYVYNELGEIISVKRKGLLEEKTVSKINSRTIYQGDNVVTQERYNPINNMVHIEDGNGDALEVQYDKQGRVEALRDGGGNEYRYIRNRNGTIRKSVFPDGSEELHTYKEDGFNILTRKGIRKEFNYDSSGRVISKDLGSGDFTTYRYDTEGNMVEAGNKAGELFFQYDSESRLSIIRFPDNETVSYTFTKRGQKASVNLTSGYNVRYMYNDKDMLTDVVDDSNNGTTLVHVEYYSNGKLKQKTLGNGAYTQFFYQQESGLLKAQHNYFANGTLSSKFEYSYDIRQRRISMRTLEGEWRFRYDISGQLTYMKSPTGDVTQFSYDERKNRKSVTKDGVQQLYKTNDLNQYTQFGSDQEFVHDKDGNLIEIKGSKSRRYSFDAENKLVEFETPDSRCKFVYDAIDNLKLKDCQGEVTQYIVDPFGKYGPDLLTEIKPSGQLVSYFHGGDDLGLVAMKVGTVYYYYQFDPLGSVISLLNTDGDLVNSYTYEPFGQVLDSKETLDIPFKFIGQWGVMGFKEAKDLHYMRARFYDAKHGRFLSPDPLGIAGKSKNFYAYAYNNPVHFTDPRGTIAPWVAAGLINTAIYAGTTLATGGDLSWGGAAGAFVGGAIGGAAGSKILQLTAGIGSKAARYFANVNLFANLNTINNMISAGTQHLVDNIIGDKAFDGNAFGGSLLNGLAQAFVPGIPGLKGNWETAATSLLTNVGNFLFDPSKSPSEKWQQVKDTWKNAYDSAKETFDKGKDALEKGWDKVTDAAQKQWDKLRDYADSVSDRVGEKWQDLKQDFRDKVDDVKQELKDTWDKVTDEVSDKWDNVKDQAKDKWNDLRDKIDEGFDKLKDDVSDGWENLKDGAKDKYDDFKNKMNEGWENLKDNIKDKVDDATKDLSDAWDNVKDKMKDLGDDLKDAYDDLSDKAKDKWDDLKDKMKDLFDDFMDFIRSRDPNDMIGPVGYGAARFIAKKTTMNFKIRYENDANASAPAQRVFIEHVFDTDINARSFRIGSFGFGNFTHELAFDRSYLQTSVNLTEEHGIFLQVRGGLDVVNGRATWEFQSIDPITGSPPTDPRIGFLPPNNGTTGQGYVTFTVEPKKDTPHLARIDSMATIYFDQNEPIETPPIFNTIDDSVPIVNATVLTETLSSGTLALSLNTSDSGSGFKDVTIFQKEGDVYQVLMDNINDSIAVLPLESGNIYQLTLVPTDYVGNSEDVETIAALESITVDFPRIEVSCTGVNNCSGNGNCTGPDICVCDDGFYGRDCSSDKAPMEPPILELMTQGGTEDHNITLYVVGKLVNGSSPSNLFVTLTGFPYGTMFYKGSGNNTHWTLGTNEFGNVIVKFPNNFAENVRLSAKAFIDQEGAEVSRHGEVVVNVMPVVDDFAFSVSLDCYDSGRSLDRLPLQINVQLGDTDGSEIYYVLVELNSMYKLTHGKVMNNGSYMLNETDMQSELEIVKVDNQTFVPFTVRMTGVVYEEQRPESISTQTEEKVVNYCQDVSTPSKGTAQPPPDTTKSTDSGESAARQQIVIVIISVVAILIVITLVVIVVKVLKARTMSAAKGSRLLAMNDETRL